LPDITAMKFAQSAQWICLWVLCLFLLTNHASAVADDEFDDIPVATDTIEKGAETLSTGNEEEFVDVSLGDEAKVKPKMSFRQLLLASGDISGKNNFFIEISFLCILGLCFWAYVYGKITNRILAIKWIAVNKELFSEQFALMSAASNSEPNPDELLSQEKGYNQFRFYASGRKHCSAFLAEITLLKRNDIFWRIIDALMYPSYDKVTLQTVLTDSASCHPFLFFLCRKGKQVSIREGNDFFQEFTSQVPNASTVVPLNSDLVMFAEVHEGVDKLFTSEDLKILNDLSDFVELISVTDLNVEDLEGVSEKCPPKKVLTCTFRLPPPGEMEKIVPLTELALRLIDTLFTLRLTIGGKNKVDRNRKVLTERVAKANAERKLLEEKEENEKKKLEKLEKEKEEYEKLPSHLKLKKDQKEEKKKKKDANKNMMKKK
jgi:hypothetical protein